MDGDAEIPCAACSFWDSEEKRFGCDPNRCKKLSNWLMKHAGDNTPVQHKKMVQYIV